MSSLALAVAIFCLAEIYLADPVVVPLITATGILMVPGQQPSPKPYAFGYEFGDGLGMKQYRRETSDGTGSVKGSYGYLDPLGVKRIVEYTADSDGYTSVVRSNEPGMNGQNPASVVYLVEPPPPAAIVQGLKPSLAKITA